MMEGMFPLARSIKKLIYISITFMILFTAYAGVQNYIASIYQQMGYSNLGTFSLFAVYFTFGIGSLLAKMVVNKLGFRKSMTVSASLYLMGIMASLIMSYSDIEYLSFFYGNSVLVYLFNLATFTLVGLGSAVIWIANGGYINSIAPKEESGKYFGTFMTINTLSALLGSLGPAFIFRIFSLKTYFAIMMFIGLLSLVLFSFIPKASNETLEDTERSLVEEYSICLLYTSPSPRDS
eukprot:TRINITY_DN19835_c0_g1_i1.p1 TRINITY_DN19835_c0_g1~~TRINITY_DN19835_c0_g1_i1.p1  ORF type:complete len:236 (-),score=21.00 TRINITY_DN19835_c0_g1_i1:37-744(-)